MCSSDLWQLRQRIVDAHQRWLGEPKGPVVSAMTLGRRAVNLPYEIQDAFIEAGLAHTLAASGFHVSLVLGLVLALLKSRLPKTQAIAGAIALLILLGAIPLLRQSLSILLALTPAAVPVDEICTALSAQDGVEQVDRLQVWAIAPGQLCLTATLSVTVAAAYRRDQLLNRLQTQLQQDFNIADATLQLVSAPAVALSTLPDTRIRELI